MGGRVGRGIRRHARTRPPGPSVYALLDAIKDACTAVCERHGYTSLDQVIETFRDTLSSGTSSPNDRKRIDAVQWAFFASTNVDRARKAIEAGDAEEAARAAIWATRYAGDLPEVIATGEAVTRGGTKGGVTTGKLARKRHEVWRASAKKFWSQDPDLTISYVAKRVAQRFGKQADAVRKQIADLHPKS